MGRSTGNGYTIPDSALHDLSPEARLLVKYGPPKVEGRAVDTRNAKIGLRTVRVLLNTGGQIEEIRDMLQTKRGRKHLKDTAYTAALEYHLENGETEKEAKRLANIERQATQDAIVRTAEMLGVQDRLARFLRQSPQVDRSRPEDTFYCAPRPVAAIAAPDNFYAACRNGHNKEYVPSNARPARRKVKSNVIDTTAINGRRVSYNYAGHVSI